MIQIVRLLQVMDKKYIRSFKKRYFHEKYWLCSSSVDNSLYCFPCLIFNKGGRSNFVRPGLRNISCISTRMKEYECTTGHIDRNFSKQRAIFRYVRIVVRRYSCSFYPFK